MPAKSQVKDLARYAANALIKQAKDGKLDIVDALLLNDIWYARKSPEMPDNLEELFMTVKECLESQHESVKPVLAVLTHRLDSESKRTSKKKAVEAKDDVTVKATTPKAGNKS